VPVAQAFADATSSAYEKITFQSKSYNVPREEGVEVHRRIIVTLEGDGAMAVRERAQKGVGKQRCALALCQRYRVLRPRTQQLHVTPTNKTENAVRMPRTDSSTAVRGVRPSEPAAGQRQA